MGNVEKQSNDEHQDDLSGTGEVSSPHAVRWGTHETVLGTHWTKWHGTDDSFKTWCGRPIPIMTEDWPHLPEVDDDIDRVTCKICQKHRESIE